MDAGVNMLQGCVPCKRAVAAASDADHPQHGQQRRVPPGRIRLHRCALYFGFEIRNFTQVQHQKSLLECLAPRVHRESSLLGARTALHVVFC